MRVSQEKNVNSYFRALSVCTGILLISIVFYFYSKEGLKSSLAASYYNIGVGSTVSINEFGTCRRVTNNCSFNIFVPTNTSAEWNAFINNKPACVTVANCGWVCPGSGGYINCTYETVYSGSSCSGSFLGYRFYTASCSSNGSGTCYRIYGSQYTKSGYSRRIYGSSNCYYGFSGCYNPSQSYSYDLLPSVAQCTWQ